MIYLEAPHYLEPNLIINWDKTIFLAGSITGAWDWQKQAKDKLLPYFHIFNPRRESYDKLIPDQERIQISWEHSFLERAEIVLFYFSHETLAPITLLELGALLEQSKQQYYKKIYISIHPEYKRKNDVIIQTELRNPQFSKIITFNLEETLNQIIKQNNK